MYFSATIVTYKCCYRDIFFHSLMRPLRRVTVKLLAVRRISVIVLQLGKLDLASQTGKMMLTMLAAAAEMERALLVERTQSGLARAKSEGKTLVRPSKTTAEQRGEIMAKHAQGESVSALARFYAVSRASILGIVNCAQQR